MWTLAEEEGSSSAVSSSPARWTRQVVVRREAIARVLNFVCQKILDMAEITEFRVASLNISFRKCLLMLITWILEGMLDGARKMAHCCSATGECVLKLGITKKKSNLQCLLKLHRGIAMQQQIQSTNGRAYDGGKDHRENGVLRAVRQD